MFAEVDLNTGKADGGAGSTYLKGKNNTEVYRYNQNKLAIYFPATKSMQDRTKELREQGVKLELFVECENEYVYLFPEKDIDKVHKILKFHKKGKDLDPMCKKTRDKVLKDSLKKIKK